MPERCCYNCKFRKVDVDQTRNAADYCQRGRKKKLLDQLKLQDECDCKYFEKDICDISTEEWDKACRGLEYYPPGRYD